MSEVIFFSTEVCKTNIEVLEDYMTNNEMVIFNALDLTIHKN